ncbi:MAG: marine proteobacterial sortase target protein [Novosphingobium sp.]|nr:marine proteobacterial sortase target protein [Novosphingobium sp.]
MRSLSRSRHRLTIGALTLLSVILTCLVAATLRAAAPPSGEDDFNGGALMLRGKGAAQAMPAIRLGTDMDVTVTGQVARVRVTQAFRNTSDRWMEATYLYPLPDDGAVDSLRMVVGQRTFVGRIEKREEARRIYEKAKAEGRKAGLVESSRPNLFRNHVANVGPRETVLIAIEYQAPVRQLGGEFALRLPLVVGPRYVPPHTLDSDADLADAADVTAPLAAPALGKSLNPVSITVHLKPGFKPANIISPYHRISVAEAGETERTITLAHGEVPADRDFELRWRSASADPTIGLFRQEHGGEQYLMASITPPATVAQGAVAPREMVFVIDNSGSMGGQSMEAARAGLIHALGTLRPQDSFNVIRFDDTMTMLFEQSTPATAEQVDLAKRFAEGLEADGGTEMLPALKAALVDSDPKASTIRQVIFLTDGDLSNEREMMAEIAANGGRSRVFMVGIGSAPNTFLMRRMAEAGRGTYTNIGQDGEVAAKMTALLDRLQRPAVHELSVSVDGAPLDLTPSRLPDLYAGEPLVLLGRSKALSGTLTVTGMIGYKPWTISLDLATALQSPAVAKLWAHRRIADIEAQRWSGQIEDGAADTDIARLGLDFALVTTQTSLVAEDTTPSRPAGARLMREELPLLLPAGWDFDALFGNDPVNTGDAEGRLPSDQTEQVELPQTATGFMAGMMQGAALLAIGLLGLVATARRRRKVRA